LGRDLINPADLRHDPSTRLTMAGLKYRNVTATVINSSKVLAIRQILCGRRPLPSYARQSRI